MNQPASISSVTPAKKRPPGRTPGPVESRTVQRSLRLLPSDWAIIDRNGMAWLRKVLRTTKIKPPPPPGPSKTAIEKAERARRVAERAEAKRLAELQRQHAQAEADARSRSATVFQQQIA